MLKIAFIGAGSLGFTRGLVRDMLTFPLLENATISLMDIDPERLEFAQKSIQRIVDMGNYPATVEATMDRVFGTQPEGQPEVWKPGASLAAGVLGTEQSRAVVTLQQPAITRPDSGFSLYQGPLHFRSHFLSSFPCAGSDI